MRECAQRIGEVGLDTKMSLTTCKTVIGKNAIGGATGVTLPLLDCIAAIQKWQMKVQLSTARCISNHTISWQQTQSIVNEQITYTQIDNYKGSTCLQAVEICRALTGARQPILELLDGIQQIRRSQSQHSSSGWVNQEQRVRNLLVKSNNVFKSSRQGCKSDSRYKVLTSGVKKVVESEPAAFVVDPFHDVHTDGVRGDDVDGVLYNIL